MSTYYCPKTVLNLLVRRVPTDKACQTANFARTETTQPRYWHHSKLSGAPEASPRDGLLTHRVCNAIALSHSLVSFKVVHKADGPLFTAVLFFFRLHSLSHLMHIMRHKCYALTRPLDPPTCTACRLDDFGDDFKSAPLDWLSCWARVHDCTSECTLAVLAHNFKALVQAREA